MKNFFKKSFIITFVLTLIMIQAGYSGTVCDANNQPSYGHASGSGGSGGATYGHFDFNNAYDSYNVQNYQIEDSEKQNMYDYETAMRRDEQVGEAWIIFETKHIIQLSAESLHLPEDVAPMKIMFSKDGENWTDSKIVPEIEPEDNRWTKVTYCSNDVEEVRFVKFIWGVENNLQNWWNPYFVGMSVKKGTPTVNKINITTDKNIVLPMYDTKDIQFEAVVKDQLDLEMDTYMFWEIISTEDEKITISDEGKLTLSADMKPGTKFTVKLYAKSLEKEKTFVLCSPLPGDTDGDNIITDTDIEFILENYGKTADLQNRLCDVDKNGIIDIIDLCYAAKHKDIDFYAESEDEKEPNDDINPDDTNSGNSGNTDSDNTDSENSTDNDNTKNDSDTESGEDTDTDTDVRLPD